MLLFVCDVVASTIAAAIVVVAIRETLPAPREGDAQETLAQTFAGYRLVLRDATFVLFIGACILMGVVYQQQYTTLGVYLRDTHGVSEQAYGLII